MTDRTNGISDTQFQALSEAAWKVRENAYILGDTKVGCAILAADGRIFVGCNVEHRFRCHDVHAEVNAVSSMVADGATRLVAVLVVAKRERFTPCGGCMDWIMQFATDDCLVYFQPKPNGPMARYTLRELMPHYPR